jgi:hypothetical protein
MTPKRVRVKGATNERPYDTRDASGQ